MRILHTSDWHVGRTIRGRSRASEHEAVLAEIAGLAAERAVDLVLVAGDLYESSAPAPESERIVYRALLALAAVAPVVVVAGNHDHPNRLDAVAPLLDLGRVTVVARPTRPDAGGLVRFDVGGVPVQLALLPFVSKRGIVRADELMTDAAYEHAQAYEDRVRHVLDALCRPFADMAHDGVNLVCAHLFAAGGVLGGGERSAHTVLDYAVSAQAFPVSAHYVALGHLHRAQDVPGATRIRYSGSPLQLDFGERHDVKSVSVVSLEPGAPARVEEVPLTTGRRLRTISGTVAELEQRRGDIGDDHLRVVVTEPRRAGMAEELRQWFPTAVDVVVRSPDEPTSAPSPRIEGRSPSELFRAYLATTELTDTRVEQAFDDLLDELSGVEGA